MTIDKIIPVLGSPSIAIHPQADPHGDPVREATFGCGCALRSVLDEDDWRFSQRCPNAWYHQELLQVSGVDPADFDLRPPHIAPFD